ncbi:Pesticidal crystal protein Cry4Ba [Bienertia sinuspersici]
MLQSSKRYEKGVEDYLDWAFATKAIGDQISCPRKLCYHRFRHRRDKVFNHLITNGIQPASNTETNTEGIPDDMDRLIYDTHRDFVERFTHNNEEVGNEPDAEAKKFYKLVEDGKEELYPGSKHFQNFHFLFTCSF